MLYLLSTRYFDSGLLSYFIRYYSERGVDRIVLFPRMEPFTSGSVDAMFMDKYRQTQLAADDWYIVADLDEFHWCPGLTTFKKYAFDEAPYDYVGGKFVDRITSSGVIPHLVLDKSLDEQFPLCCNFIESRNRCPYTKVSLCRANQPISDGHHTAPGRVAPFTFQTHHFKWHTPERLIDWLVQRENNVVQSAGNGRGDNLDMVQHLQQFGGIDTRAANLHIYSAPKIGI